MTTVTLSLISHTNVGKTTLARTLLRRDVGEVLDQAHVTEVSEAHILLQTPDAELRLWDTPGFGDTARLIRRLRRQDDPVGWFLHTVWDRVANRPLWCSQEAVRNIRDEADVVLYLVNAAEEPEDAGYVSPELEILAWMNLPVVVLLNQVGDGDGSHTDRWRTWLASRPVVRDVLSLDAFTRSWVEEDVLLRRIVPLLAPDRRAAMEDLARGWERRNVERFDAACVTLASWAARAAIDREPLTGSGTEADGDDGKPVHWAVGLFRDARRLAGGERGRAMAALGERLDEDTGRLMHDLIAMHDLRGGSEARIEQDLQDLAVRGAQPISDGGGAIAGAVISGALGGLAADAMAGGLTLGGGMIAGMIVGALGGTALARGYRLVGGARRPSVQWTPAFLDRLLRQGLLRYLAVAHFGRGRGDFRDLDQPQKFLASIDAELSRRESGLTAVWNDAAVDAPPAREELAAKLRPVVRDTLRDVFRTAYPDAFRTGNR